MPPDHQSSYLRFPYYVGLGVLLLALGFAVPWVIFHRPFWITQNSGPFRPWIESALHRIYCARLSSWPETDTNGNSVPDWYEELGGADLRKDAMEARCIVWERPGYVFLGERTRVRLELQVGFYDHVIVRWPKNTEILVTAVDAVLLPVGSAEGTPPTAGPLRVQVSPEGRVEFDVLYLRAASNGRISAPEGHVTLTHARSGYEFATYPFKVTQWRRPSVPSRIEQRSLDLPPEMEPAPRSTDDSGSALWPHLVWDPLPEPGTIYILEAARADLPNDWYGFKQYSEPPFSELIDERHHTFFPGYTGPLLYRVVPVSMEKPVGR